MIPTGGTQAVSCAFSYSAASYTDADPDPTPTVTGTSGGTFTSTAGIVINASTGEIDLSASTLNTYVITYTVRGKVCTQSVEITASFSNTKSLAFDGVDEYVAIGTTSLGITSAISVSAWVKTTATGAYRVIACEDATGGATRSWNLFLSSSNKVGWFVWNTDGTVTSFYRATANEINDGDWHHVLATYDGTTDADGIKLYIDGNLESATAGSTGIRSTAGVEPAIGSLTGNVGWRWNGNIDEVSVFDAVKVVADVSDGTEPIDLTGKANLVSWWRMGDKVTSFPTIPDQEGSNDGTANNMEISDIETDVPA